MSTDDADARALAGILREEIRSVCEAWEREVVAVEPELAGLSRPALIDHLPEFLEGLCAWLESERDDAQQAFRLLSEGHAVQRQSAGIRLETLTSEYAILRRTILERLGQRGCGLTPAVLRLHAGLDTAIYRAVHRYSHARDEVRERFIGILAHDLRDPLAAVLMSASMLASSTLTTSQASFVARISRGGARMERMISDVLDFTRGRLSAGIPIVPAAGDLGEVCREVVDEAKAARQVELGLEVSGDLRGTWDAERVKQALANLVSNAFHHGTGGVTLRAWEREDRRAVFTSVSNLGPPIPTELMSRLFDPFTRPMTARVRGLGLGLFIVQQIALAHGGECRVSSTAENGTIFTIEWPRVPIEEGPDRTAR